MACYGFLETLESGIRVRMMAYDRFVGSDGVTFGTFGNEFHFRIKWGGFERSVDFMVFNSRNR